MDTYNNEGQYGTDQIVIDYSNNESSRAVATSNTSTGMAKYGLTETDYEQLVEDCEESVEMYDHIHHFLTTNEDVQRYLF